MVGIARRAPESIGPIGPRSSCPTGLAPLRCPIKAWTGLFPTTFFDLLSLPLIATVLEQAHRILVPDGLLCLVSLTYGRGFLARAVCATWQRIHALSPALVGGCRPLDLTGLLGPSWLVRYAAPVTNFALTSQVLVASPSR